MEKYSGEYDPIRDGYKCKIISKTVSNNVWDIINYEVEQLKEDFPEKELLKKATKSKKDMYLLNFLYGDLDVGAVISLFYERTRFDTEYEISNNCIYEPMDKYALIAMEKSAKQYLKEKQIKKLKEKPFIKK